MKKYFSLILLLGIAITASAQFKVYSNGNISLKSISSQALSPLSLNSIGDSSYFVHYSGNRSGMYIHAENATLGGNCSRGGYFISTGNGERVHCGLTGTGETTNSTSNNIRAVGVQGMAKNTGTGFSIGLFGTLLGNGNGAAVYGAAFSSSFTLDDRYAGYFKGKTKVSGDLHVTGNIVGQLLTNAPGSLSTEKRELDMSSYGDISQRLSAVSALTYRQRRESERLPEDGSDDTTWLMDNAYATETENRTAEKDLLGRQYDNKLHYALDANQLEEVLPDLVYEREDGSKAINYVEMVPLLVQSINELNGRIQQLEGANARLTRAAYAGAVPAPNAGSASVMQAVLYQNTPNPFTVRTEIRFSLPDDARSAYIYIFDMTGKMLRQIPVDSTMQSVTINGYELSAGIYLYSLVINGQEIDTKRMILSK